MSVDRGQADRLATLAELGVDLLRAAEPGQPVEDGRDSLGLPGTADPGALRPDPGRALGEVHNSHGSSQDRQLWPTNGRRAACGRIEAWLIGCAMRQVPICASMPTTRWTGGSGATRRLTRRAGETSPCSSRSDTRRATGAT